MRSLAIVALTAVLTTSVSAPAATAAPVGTGLETVPLDASSGLPEIDGKQFALVALKGTGSLPDRVEIQVKRAGGDWGAWQPLHTDDAIDNKTEPLWVGRATAIRVRGADRPGLSLALIDPGVKASDTQRQRAAVASGANPPAVIGRAAWGADESVRTACFARQGIGIDYAGTIKAATIHHTAGTNDYTAADSAAIVRGVYMFHAIDRDWCDIGYNFLVDKYGQVFEGRIGGIDSPVWGAHAGGFNQFTSGVSMMGDFGPVAPNTTMLDAVASVVAWKLSNGYRDPNGSVTLISGGGGTSKYPAGTAVTLPTIFAHRDVGNTECPGQLAYDLMPTIRQKVTERMGDWTASPIYQRWQATGADNGPLQGPFRLENDTFRGGRFTTFLGNSASVYWSQATGAKIVQGAIRDRWSTYGWENGRYGFPVTDEIVTADGVGRYNDFELNSASIYWTNSTGAHAVEGAIKERWTALAKDAGELGYPTTDESAAANGGRYNDFHRGGSIYWAPATGAHSVQGLIRDKWAAFGKEGGIFGYPLTDETVGANGGRYNDFAQSNGSIYWSATTGAHAVMGAIKSKYAQYDKESGLLGYPATDESTTPDTIGRYNHFQQGSIYWTNGTGAHEVHGLIRQRWAELGWEKGYLGYPTSDEHTSGSLLRSDFQFGYITFNPANGQVLDRRY